VFACAIVAGLDGISVTSVTSPAAAFRPIAAETTLRKHVLISQAGLPERTHSIDMEAYNPRSHFRPQGDSVFAGGTDRCSPALPA
jgi:hypothetical protein